MSALPPPPPGFGPPSEPPGYGPGYVPAGPPAHHGPAAQPESMKKAVLLMRIAGVLALLSLVLVFTMRDTIEEMIRDDNPTASDSTIDAAVGFGITFALIFGLLGAGLWFWMAWANGEGKTWARTLATVFFAVSVLGLFSNLAQPSPAISKLLGVVQFLLGLGAIIFMYRPESSHYYRQRSAGY